MLYGLSLTRTMPIRMLQKDKGLTRRFKSPRAKYKACFKQWQCFELWLLLFLTDVKADKPLPRKEVYALIQEEIRKNDGFVDFVYKHGDTEILELVNTIGNEQVAIARATLLLDAHLGKSPIDTNPSTRVHLLVKEIREWIKYYNYKPD